MKFGFRKPSINKRISARISPQRIIRHRMGVKAPRGFGIFTNPKKAAYNKVYNRTTRDPVKGGCTGCGCLIFLVALPLIFASGYCINQLV